MDWPLRDIERVAMFPPRCEGAPPEGCLLAVPVELGDKDLRLGDYLDLLAIRVAWMAEQMPIEEVNDLIHDYLPEMLDDLKEGQVGATLVAAYESRILENVATSMFPLTVRNNPDAVSLIEETTLEEWLTMLASS